VSLYMLRLCLRCYSLRPVLLKTKTVSWAWGVCCYLGEKWGSYWCWKHLNLRTHDRCKMSENENTSWNFTILLSDRLFYKMIYGELEATNYQFLLEEKTMDDAFGVCQWGRFFLSHIQFMEGFNCWFRFFILFCVFKIQHCIYNILHISDFSNGLCLWSLLHGRGTILFLKYCSKLL